MDEVYEDIHKEEAKEDRKSNRNPIRRLIHYIKLGWKWVLDYSVPPTKKEEWAPLRTGISLILAPFVSAFAYGSTPLLIQLPNPSQTIFWKCPTWSGSNCQQYVCLFTG
jgi:hypothetical protein